MNDTPMNDKLMNVTLQLNPNEVKAYLSEQIAMLHPPDLSLVRGLFIGLQHQQAEYVNALLAQQKTCRDQAQLAALRIYERHASADLEASSTPVADSDYLTALNQFAKHGG